MGASQQHDGKYNEYYRTCLLYLAHVRLDTDDIPTDEKQRIAFHLAVSALLGDEIHNFGEFIDNPITVALPEQGCGWLLDLLRAFNTGDLSQYQQISQEHATALRQHL